jgi:hypothetical protein
MLLNLWEHEMWTVWQEKFRWPHLCPVLWCSPTGSTLVMQRASPDAAEAEVAAMLGRYYPDITCEGKIESWGHIEGRLVAIDYGPDGWTVEDIQKHRDDYGAKTGPAVDTR